MNKAATLTAAVVIAGAALFATGSAAAPPPTTIKLVAEGAPTHVDELQPGIADTRVQILAAAGDDDLSFILDCAIELDRGRLVFSGAELRSHVESETT